MVKNMTAMRLIGPLVALVFVAGSAHADSSAGQCGSIWTVARGESLSRVAAICNTTVEALLAANPGVTNPDRIYAGEKLQIPTGQVQTAGPSYSAPSWGYPFALPDGRRWYIPTAPGAGGARVSLAPDSGAPGAEVEIMAARFPPRVKLQISVGTDRTGYFIVTSATTAADGTLDAKMTIPERAFVGEYWVVQVVTIAGQRVEARSNPFAVVSSDAELPTVSIDPDSGPPGTIVQISATDLAPNVAIVLSAGPQDAEPVLVSYEQTDEMGSLSTTIVIPADAMPGESWVVALLEAGLGGRPDSVSETFTVTP